MTSKERAALRAQANTIDTTLMVGKGGVSKRWSPKRKSCWTFMSW